MGVTLYFSNQLMPLADRLQQNLIPDSDNDDLFDSPMVIVPNMNLSKWIKLTLSRRTDVFMNVAFDYLESGLWHMISAMVPSLDSASDLLDKDRLKILVFFILMALDGDNADVEPIVHYLGRGRERANDDREMRCWQLSEELTRLFQEYEYHRSDMIQRWLDGNASDDPMEVCQKWLYCSVQALKAKLGSTLGRPLVTMAEYARKLPASFASDGEPQSRRLSRVHVFGISQISPFHLQLFSQLQTGFDIHIYSLNPSREYWEDIKTPFERKWIARKNVGDLKFSETEWAAGDLFTPVDHELLSAWGKPGRENIRLLCQLTDYDFHAGFSESSRQNTVLSAITHGLLTLTEPPVDRNNGLPQDTSLQIMACPGIRREVETVYNNILHNLEVDPDLCMTDIAVMVSDMSRYKPVVDSVFSRQPARITYNLVDASARTESLFAQAVLSFIVLARGTFSRKEVFDLLRNPCVMQRWNYNAETLAIWIGWADVLGIFHGFANPTGNDENLPGAGLFSWRQGLERLRLSRIMTPTTSGIGSLRYHFNGMVPFADINTGDDRLLEKFCRLIPALHAAVAGFKKGSATAREWRDMFFEMVDGFIEIAPDMRGEETVLQSLLNSFDQLVHYDSLMQISHGRMLTAEALWAFVRSHLEGITGGQGDYLTGGVTVSALMPMRPIPFKIVYVMGLEEGRFPGRSTDSLLDLRIRKRRIGDVSLAERNRYLFLEILISVERKLYLSYVSRDLQKDRDLAPCSVIHQLRRHVELQILGGKSFRVQQIPIKADSARYLAPDAVNHWSDAMVQSASVVHRISGYRRSGLWDAMAEQITPDEKTRISRYLPDFTLPEPSPSPESVPTASLTIGLLRRFLLDPVGVAERFHLGIHEQVDPTAELADMENEPLASQFPIDYEIRTMSVQNWLVNQFNDVTEDLTINSLASEFDDVYQDLTRKSRVPAGAFATHDRSRLKDQVLECGETLLPFILRMRSARQLFSAVTIGSAMDDKVDTGGVQLKLNSVKIDVPISTSGRRPTAALLNGGLPWVWQEADNRWHCLVVTGSGLKPRHADKYVLSPLLALMAIAASDEPSPWADSGQITIHIGYQNHMQHLDYRLSSAECTAYLTNVIADFYTFSPLVWLPFEAVIGHRALRSYIEQDDVNETDREAFRIAMVDAMLEAIDPIAELCGATVPPHILKLARRRFRIFLTGSEPTEDTV